MAAIIYTDIARDGVLKGLNIEATLALAEALAIPVDRIRRPCLASPMSSVCCSPTARVWRARSPAAPFMTAGSIPQQALALIKAKRVA